MEAKEIENLKEKMLNYVDFFGGGFIDLLAIRNATTKEELEKEFQKHHDFMADALSDAQSSLAKFKKEIGL